MSADPLALLESLYAAVGDYDALLEQANSQKPGEWIKAQNQLAGIARKVLGLPAAWTRARCLEELSKFHAWLAVQKKSGASPAG